MAGEILPFPPRNKGRVRKTRSPDSMGRCAIGLLERDGESVPPNVADVRSAKPEPHVSEERLSFVLTLAIFSVLTDTQKASIRDAVRICARHDDTHKGDECRVLYPIITCDQLS